MPAETGNSRGPWSSSRPGANPSFEELIRYGRFKRINYNESVRPKIYDRMISERRQIAERSLSEGNGEAARVRRNRVRELNKIQSEAYRQVEENRGVADAKATDIYASAYNQSPEAVAFYEFARTMGLPVDYRRQHHHGAVHRQRPVQVPEGHGSDVRPAAGRAVRRQARSARRHQARLTSRAAPLGPEENPMRLPPPLATPAVVAVALAGTGLMQPAQQPPAQAAVVLPTAIHDGLLLQAQDGIDTDGRPLTVVQLIEVLAREQT